MPKIAKNRKNEALQQKKRTIENNIEMEKQFMMITAIKTYLIALIMIIFSLLLNLELITIPEIGSTTTTEIICTVIKILLILLFFFYAFVSIGNLRELQGHVLDWKGLLILIVIALIQGIMDGWVFFGSLIGISIIMIYFYLMQAHIQD